MALNLSTNPTFSGRVTAADANYPYGSSKNETSPGANDGTPYNKQRADDLLGFMQALLSQAGIVPSGSADTAVASQYVDAIRSIINGEDAATLGGQNGAYYRNLANSTGTLPSSNVTGDFAQSRITNLVADLAAKTTLTTNLSVSSVFGATGWFQLGNLLFQTGGGFSTKNGTLSYTYDQVFDQIINFQLSFLDPVQDFTPYPENITNSGFDVTADNSSGPASSLFHYFAIGWKI